MATITGTAGNDTIKGTTGADEMTGLTGNDVYTVNHCDDAVVEAPAGGTDTVIASHLFKLSDNVENLTLTGTAAIDGYGNDENNVITGNSGPNLLVTGAGIDTVNGGDGNDVLVLAGNLTAADKLDGGKGLDTMRLDGDYAAGVAFTATTMVNVEQIALADGNDYKLTLVDANNGSSLIVDGSLLTGANTLHIDASAETASALIALGGEGDDTLIGGSGADSFIGGKGADIITGGLGSDTISYDGSATGVTIDLNSALAQTGGDAAGDKLSGIENAVGSAVADTLTGTAGNNKLSGGAGNDTITSGAGDDVVLAGDGDDALYFAANLAKTDFIDGGDGEDALSIAGNYAAGFTFDAARFKNLESVVLGAGFDYKLVLTDGTNAVGFAVDGSALGAGDNLILSGTAETFGPLAATGGAGDDSIASGSGNDILTAGTGVDILIANKGDDTFVMEGNLTAADRIDGGIGNDKLVLDGDYSGGLTFSKTTAINLESIVVTDGNDYVLTLDNATNSKSLVVDGRALTGGSQLNLNAAAETINAVSAFGGAGADTLTGGGGNDTLAGGAGADIMDGGKGSADVVTYAAAAAAIGFGTSNFGDGAGDVLANVEVVIGSEFDDWITGDATINRIEGGFGNDTLVSGAGTDKLLGGGDNDTLALAGNLTAADQIDGGDGEDDLATLDGNYAAGVTFTKTTMVNVEEIELADGNSYKLTLADDTNKSGLLVDGHLLTVTSTLNLNAAAEKSSNLFATGGAGNDTLAGGNGHDQLVGNDGDDQLTGNGGNDLLEGSAGTDTLNGGAGTDTATYITSAAAVQVNLALLTAQVSTGDASGDKINAVENLVGSNFADVLTGNTLGNRLEGGVGADTINGGAGIDLASYASSGAVTVDLNLDGVAQIGGGHAAGDKINADIEGIAGGNSGDELIGDAGNNVLEGAGGSDTITAGLGIDRIDGGSGSDLIVFDTSLTAADVINGGDGTDTVTLSASAAYAAGLALGKTSFSSVEVVELGDGNDYRITLNDANASAFLTVDGSALTGSNILVFNGAAETLATLTAIGGDGNDILTGGKGNDELAGGAGADLLTGGNGSDTASYGSSVAGVTVNLALTLQTSAGEASGDRLVKIENLSGSANADILTGDKNSNVLSGGAGADTLQGGAGFDLIMGGSDIDTASYAASSAGVNVDLLLTLASGGDAEGDFLGGIENLLGSNFADRLTGDANANKLEGGTGNDTLTGGEEADVLDGGAGIDTASYADSDEGVTINLATNVNEDGTAKDDQLSNIENLLGSEFDDSLTGDANGNKLEGGDGDDTLTSGAGIDWLLGGSAQDTFVLGGDLTALDKIDGGNNADTMILAGDYSAGVVFGATTVVSVEEIVVSDGNSYKLTLSNTTNSSGLTVDGAALTGTNALFLDGHLETQSALAATGGDGDDTLIGGTGSDKLTGGDGNDVLTGNSGNDLLTGGAGKDAMTGGLGVDTATYAASADGVTVDLTLVGAQISAGDASGDVLSGIENLTGSANDDSLTGDGNANLLIGGVGADTLAGGGGSDTASYASAAAGVTVDLSNNANNADDEAQGDVLSGIENLLGSKHADDLRGDANNNRLEGGDGGDTLTAGAGVDALIGGDGGDQFILGANMTTLDQVNGGSGDDSLFLDGNYAAGLTFGAATAINIENIQLADGNSYALKLNNATNSSTLWVNGGGLTGANTLILDGKAETSHALTASGGDANDIISGGGGHDLLSGNGGADKLTGNGGSDTASYIGSAAGVTVSLTLKGAQASAGDAAGDVLASIENVTGSSLDDLLTGDKGANRLSGKGGVDTLNGGDGNDVLEGGEDGDILNGGDGSDTASYEDSGSGVTASLDDIGDNTGDAAGDVYTSIENLTGSKSGDTLIGNGDANKLSGGDGADTLVGDCGLDTIAGGDGDDVIDLGHDFTALDRIDGGDGTDTVQIDGNYSLGVTFSALTMVKVEEIEIADGNSYKFTLSNATNGLTIDGSVLTGANWLYVNGAFETSADLDATGGSGADTLIGGGGEDDLAGGAGNDSLTGGNGNDELDGGAGNDTLNAGEGSDTIATGAAAGIDFVLAGGGNDVIAADAFLTSAERIDGGLGSDTLVLDGDYSGGIVFTTTTVTSIEKILLEDNGSYKLTLNDATVAATAMLTVDASQLTGGNALNFNGAPEKSGSLMLLGGEGDDTLIGGGGIDAIGGSLGADVINGGGNVDVLSYENSAAGVTIDLTLAGAQGGGGDGAGDVISNIENLIGSAFDDELTGDAFANGIVGGAGNDTIDGGGGIDTVSYIGSGFGVNVDLTEILQGGVGHAAGDELTNIENVTGSALGDHIIGDAGNNVLDGAGGSDLLIGGAGNDTMTGGSGVDTFAWLDTLAGKDTITDFDSGTDILDISDLLSGFDPLTSDANDFVRFLQSAGNTTVQLDVNGTVGGSDFVTLATLKGVTGTVDGFVGNGSLDLT